MAALGAPSILRAETGILKTTAWGGKWGEVMKAQVIPAFEREMKCKVEADAAGPFFSQMQAAPPKAPLYYVRHAHTKRPWQAGGGGLGAPKIAGKKVP